MQFRNFPLIPDTQTLSWWLLLRKRLEHWKKVWYYLEDRFLSSAFCVIAGSWFLHVLHCHLFTLNKEDWLKDGLCIDHVIPGHGWFHQVSWLNTKVSNFSRESLKLSTVNTDVMKRWFTVTSLFWFTIGHLTSPLQSPETQLGLRLHHQLVILVIFWNSLF